MSDFFQSILDVLRAYVEAKHGGNVSSAARALNVSIQTLHTWLNGTRRPQLAAISPALDELQATVVLPDRRADAAPTKDVCFVNAKLMPAGERVEPPQAEDYLAAPLVGEVGAGPGYVDQGEILSWFLVYRHALPAGHTSDLIAVQIGDRSTSMQPTLYPGDIVLVDRGDKHISHSGRMMLVRDPDDGSGMVKRVAIQPGRDDALLVYYSDNAAEYEPVIFSVRNDLDGDLNKAIVGRVIWAWSDVRNK